MGCLAGTFSPSRRQMRSTVARKAICRANLPIGALVVDDPAGLAAQQLGALAIAVAPVLANERDDVGGEFVVIVAANREAALRGAMLPGHPADPALGHLQFRARMVDAGAATRRARKFPLAASAGIILSSVRSETA